MYWYFATCETQYKANIPVCIWHPFYEYLNACFEIQFGNWDIQRAFKNKLKFNEKSLEDNSCNAYEDKNEDKGFTENHLFYIR